MTEPSVASGSSVIRRVGLVVIWTPQEAGMQPHPAGMHLFYAPRLRASLHPKQLAATVRCLARIHRTHPESVDRFLKRLSPPNGVLSYAHQLANAPAPHRRPSKLVVKSLRVTK